jgi:hypothetical protein
VVEGDQLAHQEEIRLGEERVGAEALREPFAPGGARPAEVPHVAAGEGRQAFDPLDALRLQGPAQRQEGLLLAPRGEAGRAPSHTDVAVASERSLEEEGVAPLFVIEEAEDAERRQQITGKFDGGWSASKAGSGKGSA